MRRFAAQTLFEEAAAVTLNGHGVRADGSE
jgi:hypothetical protein